jgi:drug/metabolite transporter (DMT)-like permease
MQAMDKATSGYLSGFIGMLIFSGSMPATRAAVADLSPVFVTLARASIAGALALALLLWLQQRRPLRSDWLPLTLVAVTVVVGFPLFSALALHSITAAHSLVYLGLLPLSTAIFSVWRAGERPRPVFWLFSCLGAALVAGFGIARALALGAQASPAGDGLMLVAIVVCGLGYAEGGRLARRLGGWQVICWALVLALPVMLPLAWWAAPSSFVGVHAAPWSGLAYVSVFSMLIGFFFWYHGLAKGGVAAVGQLQLLQPFFGLALAALLLHERVSAAMLLVTLGVVACVAGARKFAT